MGWKATCDVPHCGILCCEEFSDSDGEHGEEIGFTYRVVLLAVGKTKAMERVCWEGIRIQNGESGPRIDSPHENVCDLGGGASKVASQMVPRWERVEERRLEFCLRAGLITLVGSMNIIEDEEARPAPDWG